MNYNKKTILDVDVAGKKILLRCDFNVPQDKVTGARRDLSMTPVPSGVCSKKSKGRASLAAVSTFTFFLVLSAYY